MLFKSASVVINISSVGLSVNFRKVPLLQNGSREVRTVRTVSDGLLLYNLTLIKFRAKLSVGTY
jgi:hypothetical protein